MATGSLYTVEAYGRLCTAWEVTWDSKIHVVIELKLVRTPIDFEKNEAIEMGGLGSGRRSRVNTKASTADYLQLDVSRWKRAGLLYLGREFGGASAAGGIGPTLSAKVYLNHVVVTQESMPASEGRRKTVIELERTDCHLGGTRTWFRCPEKDCAGEFPSCTARTPFCVGSV